jgi:hypothetical protein
VIVAVADALNHLPQEPLGSTLISLSVVCQRDLTVSS